VAVGFCFCFPARRTNKSGHLWRRLATQQELSFSLSSASSSSSSKSLLLPSFSLFLSLFLSFSSFIFPRGMNGHPFSSKKMLIPHCRLAAILPYSLPPPFAICPFLLPILNGWKVRRPDHPPPHPLHFSFTSFLPYFSQNSLFGRWPPHRQKANTNSSSSSFSFAELILLFFPPIAQKSSSPLFSLGPAGWWWNWPIEQPRPFPFPFHHSLMSIPQQLLLEEEGLKKKAPVNFP
jgi:hypothetical protein